MTRIETDYFLDMQTEIKNLEDFTADIHSIDEFRKDIKTIHACIRSLDVIGEAAKNISPQTRSKYPQVPWKQISGARDIFIHNYTGIDLKVVWDTIHLSLPVLKAQVELILREI